jgi:hypothetical protein
MMKGFKILQYSAMECNCVRNITGGGGGGGGWMSNNSGKNIMDLV